MNRRVGDSKFAVSMIRELLSHERYQDLPNGSMGAHAVAGIESICGHPEVMKRTWPALERLRPIAATTALDDRRCWPSALVDSVMFSMESPLTIDTWPRATRDHQLERTAVLANQLADELQDSYDFDICYLWHSALPEGAPERAELWKELGFDPLVASCVTGYMKNLSLQSVLREVVRKVDLKRKTGPVVDLSTGIPAEPAAFSRQMHFRMIELFGKPLHAQIARFADALYAGVSDGQVRGWCRDLPRTISNNL